MKFDAMACDVNDHIKQLPTSGWVQNLLTEQINEETKKQEVITDKFKDYNKHLEIDLKEKEN